MNIQEEIWKSGFVAVAGRPNVGKSTLVNVLIGQKIAAVSPRPQTTRRRQMGILTISEPEKNAQVVFIDTPGIHQPRHKLGELMNREAQDTLSESDLALLVVDASQPPDPEDKQVMHFLARMQRKARLLLALNKVDLVDQERLAIHRALYLEGLPQAEPLEVSALNGQGLPELMEHILALLPNALPFFPEDQLTDLYEREIAADLIREAALNTLRDEVPHGIAVRIDQFTERGEQGAYIEATVFVERKSHKPIVIGENGQMIKRLGMLARQEIEKMSGRKVYLQLRVKVRKDWRDDEKTLKSFGF